MKLLWLCNTLIPMAAEQLNIEIEESKYRTLNTVDDLVQYLESKL